jgi:hypothetical protein
MRGVDQQRMWKSNNRLRIALGLEEEEEYDWKPFRNGLGKPDRKKFLMRCLAFLDFTSLSLLSYAVQPVRLYLILMSILLHHFKELTECIKEVERIEAKVNNSSKQISMNQIRKEEEKLSALDGFL